MSAVSHLRSAAAAHFTAGRFAEAVTAYGALLATSPGDFEALHRLGLLNVQAGAHEEGRRLLEAALAVDSNHADAWLHHGMALQNLGRREDAVLSYRRALSLAPNHAAALFRLAVLLRQLGQPSEALALLERCAALAPEEKNIFQQRGELRAENGDTAGALADFATVLAADPFAAPALIGRAAVLTRLKRYSEALAVLDRVATLVPGRAETHLDRGVVLEGLGRNEDAMAAYDRALDLHPGFADAWSNRGELLRHRGRLREAEEAFSRAIAAAPRHPAALASRGLTRAKLSRHREAMADFRQALESEPGNTSALGGLAAASLALCDWQTLEILTPRLLAERSGGIAPFEMILAFDDSALLQNWAAAFIRKLVKPLPGPRPPLRASSSPSDGRIRLAYVSADFQVHATAFLIADLIERHDRSRFEVIGVSFGTDEGGAMRARLRAAFDYFLDLEGHSDAGIAKLLRQLDADIVIDLKGYTLGARPAIFAQRPAPLQVSWLGYPGTTGAPWYDYVLADAVVLPHDQQPFYDEKIVHLPDCYQPNDSSRPLGAVARAEAGLPQHGFVFCSFNQHRKVTRAVFGVWMRLLAAVPGSLLWLLDDSANETLRTEAAAHGIDPTRLIFVPRIDLPAHLARTGCADLMLDTMPYGAHTTASDALWAGVPIVTVLGPSFANRVAASLLGAIGLPELITPSLEGYEALALALARDPARLAALKEKLAANRLTTPLFDAPRFCCHIERAYEMMLEIARAGEAPHAFDVPVIEGLR